MSQTPQAHGVDTLLEALLALPAAGRAARLGREPDPAGALEALAQRGADLAIGETAKGESAARMAVALADEMARPGLRARARVALAHVLNYANRFDEALAVLREATALAGEGADQFAAARARLISMHALARLGRMDEALGAGDAAIAGFSAIDESQWRAKADVNVGVIRRMRDDPQGALAHFDAALPVFGDAPAITAQIESNRAEALLDLGRFAEAERAFASALAAFSSAGVARAAAIAEGNLADLLGRQGRFDVALEHFERARRALATVGAPADLARLRAEEADALAAIGMLSESTTAYREALSALEGAGLPAESARAGVGLARVLWSVGRVEEASGQLARAVAAFEAIPNATGAARAGVLLARIRLSQGRPDDAAALLDRHEPALRDRPIDDLAARWVRASIAIRAGDHAGAIRALNAAITEARTLGVRPIIVDLMHARAVARRGAGDLSGAIGDLQEAIDLSESLRAVLQADRLRAAALDQRSDLYADCVQALLERASGAPAGVGEGADAHAADGVGGGSAPRGDADRALAFETVDRGRARALLDAIGGTFRARDFVPGAGVGSAEGARQFSDEDPALLHELDHRRADMNAIYAALFAPQDRRLAPETRQRLTARLDEHERRVSEIERRLASTRRFGALTAPVATLGRVQGVLDDDEALLEFFGAGGGLGVAVVRPTSLHIRPDLARVGEVTDLGERISMAIDRAVIWLAGSPAGGAALDHGGPRPASSGVVRLLQRLHAMTIAPIEPLLGGVRRLLIAPHGPLHALPLHAAMATDRPLLDRFEIASIPSAAFVCQTRGGTRGRSESRAEGDAGRRSPDSGSVDPPLIVGVSDEFAPEMSDEARDIARVIPGAHALIGAEATFDAFARLAPRARLIHLACHGVFAARNPMQARLRFSDRWVTVRDLLPLALRAGVVVLSGCETGKAGVDRGDEAFGLGRVVLAAGASSALLSLWPVHDRTTRRLMISMYQAAFAGYLSGAGAGGRPGIAGALAHAQREMARRGEHPAVWAPFVLVGDPRP